MHEESYHKVWFTLENRMHDILQSHLGKINPQLGPMLDWGCSFGISTHELAELFDHKADVVGLEIEFLRPLLMKNPGFTFDSLRQIFTGINKDTFTQVLADYKKLNEHRKTHQETSKINQTNDGIFTGGDGYNPPFAQESFGTIFMMNNLTEIIGAGKLPLEKLVEIITKNLQLLKRHGKLVIGSNTGSNDYILFITKDSLNQFSIETEIQTDEDSDPISSAESQEIIDQIKQAIDSINQKYGGDA